jgi:hypothetical protein
MSNQELEYKVLKWLEKKSQYNPKTASQRAGRKLG